ncbi:NYN domain-containing protein [Corynebacterium sp.]|uniref:NYN domain-containing protein n=1 Tax=Corynebacterium sp. TaxID=1720 RepID=UPI0026DAAAAE|nr:NYN domain-containing protein [Corynebacterium sp.]MDO5033206.1 NYN domain-containing protein [Corynebacterium sp.]
MLERTLVFVDTSYLLASFYNSWEIGARAQLEIDLPEVVATLGGMIEHQVGNRIHRQNWYDGIPDTGPHRYQRALRTCNGVQLRTGQLIEWGERRTQKAVDTRLVADMVIAAMKGDVTDFVLVSGDADMIPGVQEAVNNGVRVHLYGFGWDSMSSALRHACDTTTILDPREDFSDAMEIQVLEGPLPPTVREPHGEDADQTAEVCEECEEPSEVEAAFSSSPKHHQPSPAQLAGTSSHAVTPADAARAATAAHNADASANKQVVEAAEAAEETKNEQAAASSSAGSANVAAGTDGSASAASEESAAPAENKAPKPSAPKPSMMAPRRKLRSKYVPLPEEVWSSAGFQSPFDVGQQYASWWFENAASPEQRDQAHLLSGGGLPPEIDRPLLQFACETLHEYTLTETQRVNLRDGFHSGIRGVLINIRRQDG